MNYIQVKNKKIENTGSATFFSSNTSFLQISNYSYMSARMHFWRIAFWWALFDVGVMHLFY